jgi:hypothetical protein
MTQATTVIVPTADAATTADSDAPIVLDMGKKSRKLIRRLRKGRGKLMDRVNGVIQDLKTDGSINASAQPIIIVIRQRAKRSVFGL